MLIKCDMVFKCFTYIISTMFDRKRERKKEREGGRKGEKEREKETLRKFFVPLKKQ